MDFENERPRSPKKATGQFNGIDESRAKIKQVPNSI
jgi:hypothetical protein